MFLGYSIDLSNQLVLVTGGTQGILICPAQEKVPGQPGVWPSFSKSASAALPAVIAAGQPA